jgi:hypothetical protein
MPKPGWIYVLPIQEEEMLEWLIVRAHPDDPSLFLIVPLGDFPLSGTADVKVRHVFPDKALCGLSTWVHGKVFERGHQVGSMDDEGVEMRLVRNFLASLARGRVEHTPEGVAAEADPEYQSFSEGVARAVSQISLLEDL